MTDITPIVVAALGALGGLLLGFAALRKSGPESGKVLVDSATAVVVILREQVDDMHKRQDEQEDRIVALEISLGQWRAWANKAIELMERAVTLITDEHREAIRQQIVELMAERPDKEGGN